MAVLLLEPIHPTALEILECAHAAHLASDRDAAVRIASSGEIEAIITRGKQRIDSALMGCAGPSLRVVARCGAGLDTVDVDAARVRKLEVVSAPGANTEATAEHALMLMLAAARQVNALDRAVRDGRWAARDTYQGVELRGGRLAVVGLGRIGTRLAELASAIGMRVAYWSAASRDERFEYRPLDELFDDADVISLHAALSDQTRAMIGPPQLRQMKPTAILVNTARGALVDEMAVAEALERRELGWYAADVQAQQPPDARSPLVRSQFTVLTPHVAALTEATFAEVCRVTVREVVGILDRASLAQPAGRTA